VRESSQYDTSFLSRSRREREPETKSPRRGESSRARRQLDIEFYGPLCNIRIFDLPDQLTILIFETQCISSAFLLGTTGGMKAGVSPAPAACGRRFLGNPVFL